MKIQNTKELVKSLIGLAIRKSIKLHLGVLFCKVQNDYAPSQVSYLELRINDLGPGKLISMKHGHQ